MKNNTPDTGSTGVLASLCLLTVILLAGCQTAIPTETTAAQEPAHLSSPNVLPVKNSTRFSIDTGQSEMRILVYRGGPLARFGHNHVMLVKEITGDIYLAKSFHDSGFIIHFPIKAIEVDPVEARVDEGEEFATKPPAEAIEATRKNMLGPAVLDAEKYPEITIRSVSIIGPEKGSGVTLQITLHGITREFTTPVAMETHDKSLAATGVFTLRTSDFNITPFSVLGGGLQVQDEIKVRFRIIAEKI